MRNKAIDNVLKTIKSSARVSYIISEYINIKKIGQNFIAQCPFHNDKNPSMHINDSLGIYKCFSCGAHGDSIAFIMNYKGVNFMDALNIACGLCNISMPNFKEGNNVIIMNDINDIFHKDIYKNPKFIEFLNNKGISDNQIKKFYIGFCNPQNPKLIDICKKNYKFLCSIGFIYENTNKISISNRIIFPIMNRNKSVIGFTGRAFFSNMNPKYLHLKNSFIFNKSINLYNISSIKRERIILVEGPTDAIAFDRIDMDAVAVLGSSISQESIDKLPFSVKNIIACFDGDEGGLNASLRFVKCIFEIISEDIIFKVAIMPSGEDPESLINKDKNKIISIINNALSPLDFLIYFYSRNIDMSQYNNRAILINKLLQFIKNINNNILRNTLISDVYSKMNKLNQINRNAISRINLGSQNALISDREHIEIILIFGIFINSKIIHNAIEHIYDNSFEYININDMNEIFDILLQDIDMSENVIIDMLVKNYLKKHSKNHDKYELQLKSYFDIARNCSPKINTENIEKDIKHWKMHLSILIQMNNFKKIQALKEQYQKTGDKNILNQIQDLRGFNKVKD